MIERLSEAMIHMVITNREAQFIPRPQLSETPNECFEIDITSALSSEFSQLVPSEDAEQYWLIADRGIPVSPSSF